MLTETGKKQTASSYTGASVPTNDRHVLSKNILDQSCPARSCTRTERVDGKGRMIAAMGDSHTKHEQCLDMSKQGKSLVTKNVLHPAKVPRAQPLSERDWEDEDQVPMADLPSISEEELGRMTTRQIDQLFKQDRKSVV